MGEVMCLISRIQNSLLSVWEIQQLESWLETGQFFGSVFTFQVAKLQQGCCKINFTFKNGIK